MKKTNVTIDTLSNVVKQKVIAYSLERASIIQVVEGTDFILTIITETTIT